jgi:general secretion pathway protein M
MIPALQNWWVQRSTREHYMLAILFALTAMLFLWGAILSPLGNSLDSARLRHARAVDDLAKITQKAAAYTAVKANLPEPLGAPIAAFVSTSGADAGFQLSRVDPSGPDSVNIALTSAKSIAFFNWINTLERRGLIVESISIRPNSDATIAVEASLKAAGS